MAEGARVPAAIGAGKRASDREPRLHAIILAGGTARRLGGVSKPDVIYRGRRLLDHVLDSLGSAITGRTVVVAPESVCVPCGVMRTLEDPPFGGPVAGIAAGLDAIVSGGDGAGADAFHEGSPGGDAARAHAFHEGCLDNDLVALLSCDTPAAGRALGRLIAALGCDDVTGPGGEIGHDGAVGRDHNGREQYLLSVFRLASLHRRIAQWGCDRLAGAPVKAVISGLDTVVVDFPAELTHDIDTPGDLAAH